MIANNKLWTSTKLLIILVLSLGLKLIAIKQSLWLDEAISANVSRLLSAKEIITVFSLHDFHPPAYYLLLHFWVGIFGDGVVSLRMPSIIFSLITAFFVYLTGRRIKDKNAGLWAAFFTAVNPLLLYYAQETRMYSLACMCLTIALYYFVRLLGKGKTRVADLIYFNLWSFLSFASFYGSIFLLAGFGFYLLINKKFKLLCLTNIGVLSAILLLSPLLLIQITNSRTMLQNVVNWSLVLGKANLKDLLLIPIKFSSGRISFYPKFFYYLVSGSWAALVFLIALSGAKKNKMLALLFVLPVVFGFIFSLWSPLMQYFRFLYLIPILALLTALWRGKFLYRIMMGLFFLGFSLAYLLNPGFHRENWKDLSAGLNNAEPVYIIDSFADPVRYYRSDILIYDLKTAKPDAAVITVIPYGEIIHGVDHNKELNSLGYQKVSQRDFREVVLEKWKLDPVQK